MSSEVETSLELTLPAAHQKKSEIPTPLGMTETTISLPLPPSVRFVGRKSSRL